MIARCPGLVAAQEANELVQMQFCKAKPCWYILFRLFFSETNAKMPYLFHVFSYCIIFNVAN